MPYLGPVPEDLHAMTAILGILQAENSDISLVDECLVFLK